MSLLPTAHAGQSFGARRIDFFTVSGEVSASDDETGRVTDTDAMVHDVRLLEPTNALAPGDTASVLRVQAGPNRRSRATAIVNHTRGTWMRAAPDATGLLARAGVTRSLNWWLSVIALALVAIAAVWPAIHGFLTEVNGGLMASVPTIDVFAEINAYMPALAGWRLETALPSGLLDTIAALGFVSMEQLTEWGLGIGATLVTVLAFAGRSWRLVYVPALAALALAAGAILGSALGTLTIIGASLAFFMVGGLVNRVRDGGRFNARVERLAEHVLRNPPQEGVRSSETAPEQSTGIAASAAIAAATATAHGEDSDASDVAPEDATGVENDASDMTSTADDITEAASAGPTGEAEAPDQSELLPAASEEPEPASMAMPEAAGEIDAAAETDEVAGADPVADHVGESDALVSATTVSETRDADTPEAETTTDIVAEAHDEVIAKPMSEIDETADTAIDASSEVESADDAAPHADEALSAVTGANAEADADADAGTEQNVGPDADDDLPSMDDVATAAALTAAEATEASGESVDEAAPDATPEAAVTVDLEDERTMPVAPPPPMPAAAPDNAVPDAAASDTAVEIETAPDPVSEADEPTNVTDGNTDTMPAVETTDAATMEPAASEDATAETIPATDGADTSVSIADDPMMEGAGDPMMASEGANDYAPGAPEVDLDRSPAG